MIKYKCVNFQICELALDKYENNRLDIKILKFSVPKINICFNFMNKCEIFYLNFKTHNREYCHCTNAYRKNLTRVEIINFPYPFIFEF